MFNSFTPDLNIWKQEDDAKWDPELEKPVLCCTSIFMKTAQKTLYFPV